MSYQLKSLQSAIKMNLVADPFKLREANHCWMFWAIEFQAMQLWQGKLPIWNKFLWLGESTGMALGNVLLSITGKNLPWDPNMTNSVKSYILLRMTLKLQCHGKFHFLSDSDVPHTCGALRTVQYIYGNKDLTMVDAQPCFFNSLIWFSSKPQGPSGTSPFFQCMCEVSMSAINFSSSSYLCPC